MFSPKIKVLIKKLVAKLILFSGPSAPENITVTVTSSPEVCLSWNAPYTDSEIVFYKVYIETVDTSSDIVDAIDLPSTTSLKVMQKKLNIICHSNTDIDHTLTIQQKKEIMRASRTKLYTHSSRSNNDQPYVLVMINNIMFKSVNTCPNMSSLASIL